MLLLDSSENELNNRIDNLKNNPSFLEECGQQAGAYVQANTGATAIILNYVAANLR